MPQPSQPPYVVLMLFETKKEFVVSMKELDIPLPDIDYVCLPKGAVIPTIKMLRDAIDLLYGPPSPDEDGS